MAREGFNAAQRSKDRDAGPVTIADGITYHPARLSNRRLHDVRILSRKAGKETREVIRASEEFKEALAEAKADGLKGADAEREAEAMCGEIDAAYELNQQSMAEQLSMLLVDDDMQHVSIEKMRKHLDEDLDTRDVGPLIAYLLGSDEDEVPLETESSNGTTTTTS